MHLRDSIRDLPLNDPAMQKVNDEDVWAAAHELVARRGQAAQRDAAERVAELERQGRRPEHALAMRVLTAVESLLDERSP